MTLFQTRNPATGEVVQTYPQHTDAQLEHLLSQAASASLSWRQTPLTARSRALHVLAQHLRADSERFARAITLEVGKPLSESAAEIRKCAITCDYYATHGPGFLTHEPAQIDAAHAWVQFDPLGVILAVMPWNFPFWQVIRCAAPALMAGNVVLLKHAESAPLCAMLLAQAFRESFAQTGFSGHILEAVMTDPQGVKRLICDERVAGVALTGSERAGAAVAQAAGAVTKPLVLELGGSDPFIVLADADIEQAAAVACTSRMINGGQSCIAAKRFIVEAPVYDLFVRRLTDHMARLRVGDPLDPLTQVGPLARADLRAQLQAQVSVSVEAGARVVLGGSPLEGPGFFYPPTVLVDVPQTCAAAREELFGPVAPVFSVDSPQSAIALANSSRYGLGAALWTRDLTVARTLATQLDAGAVAINDFVKSDARLPFGGVKASGYGRELGVYGMRAFANIKSVWVGA